MDGLYGKFKGYVRRNDDPERRGRIVCYCPQVMGEVDTPEHWLDWAEPCLPWMGNISTIDFGVPPTAKQCTSGKDEYTVWIEFEMGDTSRALWTGVTPIAPKVTDALTRMLPADAAGQHGGSLIDDPASIASLDALKNPAPLNEYETRILAKEGRDILIGSKTGGYMVCGPSGIHFVGVQVTVNGRLLPSKIGDG